MGRDPLRSVRIADAVWQHWKKIAVMQNISVSEMVRDSVNRRFPPLKKYLDKTEM
jgi:hypothetical protein